MCWGHAEQTGEGSQFVNFPSAGVLGGIDMVTRQRGWAVGAGVILGTEDGSRWAPEYEGPEDFGAVHALDALHAWAVGERELFGTRTAVVVGASWGQPDEPLRSVHFVGPDRGFGVSGFRWAVDANGGTVPSRAGSLVNTSNGGQTWERIPGAPCGIQSICFASLDDGAGRESDLPRRERR